MRSFKFFISLLIIISPNLLASNETRSNINSPTHISIEENKLLDCCTPPTPKITLINQITADQAFKKILDEKIEHRYINGSCEDRAHFISMILNNSGISSGKIWIIAPVRFTLLSQEILEISDPYRKGETVKWGFHVAPFIEVASGGETKKLVIDLSFSPNKYLTLDEWLTRINNPRALYFYTNSNSYLFNSLNDLTIYDNNRISSPPTGNVASHQIPSWFPNILTGDFNSYDKKNHAQKIASGMALNDAAMRLYYDYLPTIKSSSDREVINNILNQYNPLIKLLDTGSYEGVDPVIVTNLKKYFTTRKSYWKNRISDLSENKN